MEAEGGSDSNDGCTTLPETKVIIISSKLEFKCSASNTILGEKRWEVGKEIVESEMKHGINENRSVTVVLTPGWWKSVSQAESTHYIKMEILHSLKLCPAPHAFLLIINLHTPFTDTHLNSVVEHMEILGEQIWKHTIVLLMYFNKKQKDTNTEQLIEKAGKYINDVIKKCGNRVHVFNYTDSNGINVEKLFHKIENLVAEHEGQCFNIDSTLLDNMEKKRRTMKKRAEDKEMQVKTKMQNLKEWHSIYKEKIGNFLELRIVLMGGRNVGKTSVMNNILKLKQKVSRTEECAMREGEVDKGKVTIIDTPGWWPYASVKETPDSIKQEIRSSVSMCPPGVHAVFLVLRSGVTFTEAHRRTVKEHMELLGKSVWKHSIVVFTKGDWMGTPTIEEHIESEGEALQWLINKCGNRYHVLNNIQWGDGKQVRELIEKVEMMVRINTMLPVMDEALDEMEDNDEKGVCVLETEQDECGSFGWDRPRLDESYFEKWKKDLDFVSDYATMDDLSEIELFEEEQRQKYTSRT